MNENLYFVHNFLSYHLCVTIESLRLDNCITKVIRKKIANRNEGFPQLVGLYQKAIDLPYTDENGARRPQFINLDMEEYKGVQSYLFS